MKNLNKYMALGLCSVALAACDDLDTTYEGGYVTTEQKEAVLKLNPDMAQAGVLGCSSAFSTYMTVYGNHFDFGYPGVMIGLDLQTETEFCGWNGYNWFRYWQGFTSPSAQGTPSGMAWYHIYDQVFNANAVAASIPEDTDDPTLRLYRAQAVGTRAFDYFVLAQLYQYNYALNPQAPCVPVITNENSDEAALNGCARATVQEVYDQILKDLDETVSLLGSNCTDPAAVVDSKPKRMISLPVAYGLRARVNLTMQNYAAAASDAQNAIAAFSGRPYSIGEVSVPTFTSLDDPSWMWGIAIAETDRVVTSAIVNFPSMTCTFSDGYVNVGAWKFASNVLYAGIPATDVRKGWFLDDNLMSANLNSQQQSYILNECPDIEPFTQVKFNSYQGVLAQSTNASDVPLMRIEEMYYILAEAQAMSGNTDGAKSTFENFIQTYRNPSYAMTASSAEAIRTAIYNDKCVEFYGEGLVYFDIMRLDRGVDRSEASNCPAQARFQIPSYSQDTSGSDYKTKTKAGVLIYCIPQGEVNGNPKISTDDNNPTCPAPTPV